VAKPAKPTFGTNAVVPSSKLSALADLADYAANPPTCIAARVAAQSLTTGTVTSISLDTPVSDTSFGLMFSAGTTITLLDAGLWLVCGSGTYTTVSGTGIRMVLLLQNGAEFVANTSPADAGGPVRVSASHIISAAAGDLVALQGYQTSGGNLNFTGRLAVTRISGF
jgi:hypothetical protein